MSPYTDEQRRRGLATRRRNLLVRKLADSPEDTCDILGVAVPRISSLPSKKKYGLVEDVETEINQLDQSSVARKKRVRIKIFYFGLVFPALIAGLRGGIGDFIATLLVVPIGLFFIYLPWFLWAKYPDPEQTSMHLAYKKYREDLSYYEYWKRRKNKDFWNKMSGHEFEKAVANLFRNIGFAADVSKQGGDGGIDILLSKNERAIAVQCKRYKAVVAPSVARDLWGTMNHLGYREGCIVTSSSFSKGVKEFVVGKNIFLIDLNDILRASGPDGQLHLRSKLGDLQPKI